MGLNQNCSFRHLFHIDQQGIQLNVVLFVFNVFFPMYPADGSKILVCTLMFVCGMSARKAALVLIGVTVPCAMLLLAYAGYSAYLFVSSLGQGMYGTYVPGFLSGWIGRNEPGGSVQHLDGGMCAFSCPFMLNIAALWAL